MGIADNQGNRIISQTQQRAHVGMPNSHVFKPRAFRKCNGKASEAVSGLGNHNFEPFQIPSDELKRSPGSYRSENGESQFLNCKDVKIIGEITKDFQSTIQVFSLEIPSSSVKQLHFGVRVRIMRLRLLSICNPHVGMHLSLGLRGPQALHLTHRLTSRSRHGRKIHPN